MGFVGAAPSREPPHSLWHWLGIWFFRGKKWFWWMLPWIDLVSASAGGFTRDRLGRFVNAGYSFDGSDDPERGTTSDPGALDSGTGGGT